MKFSRRSGTLPLVLFVCVLVSVMGGCAADSYIPGDPVFDVRFAGIWRGELTDETTGVVRRWKKKRRPDGTMMINIGVYNKDGVYMAREILSGAWWTEENLYYEKLPSLDHLMVTHAFEFENAERVKFTVGIAGSEDQDTYSFTEVRVGDI